MNKRKKTILVVDDSPTVRRQVAAALTVGGFEIRQAQNGAEALAILKSGVKFSAVVSDINMPQLSGIELVEQAQCIPAVPPFLLLTTMTEPALISRAKKAGAKAWVAKPFKADLLLKAVDNLTRLAPV